MNRAAIASTIKLAVACGVALMLAGCGVRGSLEPEQAAKATGQGKSAEAGAAGQNSAAAPKPHRPFVLDGLLR